MAASAGENAPAALVIGAGLAGSLLALALRQRGVAVTLLDQGEGPSATELSYGVVPGWPLAATPLARLAARAGAHWRALQRRHGPLGWHPARLRLPVPLPVTQVDGAVLHQRLPGVLAAAGVERRPGRALALQRSGTHWTVDLRDGPPLLAEQVVLAAGSGCRPLWPALPPRLCSSWAGVLQLQERPPALAADQLLLPRTFQRLELERRVGQLEAEAWVVDPGLVPRGSGALVGQLTLVGSALDREPDPQVMERRLRLGLEPLALEWQRVEARYRQAPVSFCSQGEPLAGPVPGAPDLWAFTGFSGGFAQVPVLAPLLAQALGPDGELVAVAARRRLRQLGVWPSAPVGG